jgi:hypothetical protein
MRNIFRSCGSVSEVVCTCRALGVYARLLVRGGLNRKKERQDEDYRSGSVTIRYNSVCSYMEDEVTDDAAVWRMIMV